MVALLTALGILLMVLGLLFSIAWHELGHLSTAKMFGIRCTQYMVGFGKTLWSTKKGDTEYGVKLVPLGGYVRMVGMIPPAKKRDDTSGKPMSRWRAMIEDAREANNVELEPGDEDRQFYQRAPWKRLIVMFAGPFMNLVLAVVLFVILLMGLGLYQPTTTVGAVHECVVPAATIDDTCPEDAEPSPAAQAGLLPGDRIVSINGEETPDWRSLQDAIRADIGPGTIGVVRDGESMTLRTEFIENQVVKLDADGDPVVKTDADGEPVLDSQGRQIPETVPAGFAGFVPMDARQPLSAGETAVFMGDTVLAVGEAIVTLPTKIDDVFGAAFLGAERTPDSPVGIVGASRIGGEIMTMEAPLVDRLAMVVNLVAGINLFLFAFNMLPILPLDGGHIVGAVWESIRRRLARLFKRPDPGPFDVAQLMPVAYVVVACFLCFSLMLLVADIVNPVRLMQ
ncbi:membrane-associated protease RseP (regulator of RpoE activity) [Spinactinospora alkalitolerans]|uniref:Membrane-associated protease RseP (Regulator of RpoE activity) n=1 Tax=Spinactinospora alkalitolerans TaxID=687207 RepID=A0A852TQ15_9ACTN|nr:site-2 protease family protein [Spinactinospora alkalitolerans]NYE46079.1 membrane-associated protease RseP (regulator of RpoE activity) [Spinactinospora alkalitolerans]